MRQSFFRVKLGAESETLCGGGWVVHLDYNISSCPFMSSKTFLDKDQTKTWSRTKA